MKTNKRKKIVASILALATGLVLAPVPANAASSPDGKTSQTAAASCYEIKQNYPNSESGAYWLWTPQMSAPQQFYCDQQTDGGGWVMIGRGRESWTEEYAGRGNADELWKTPSGTGAFSPVQLSSATVDALLNEQAPSSLSDGIRFRRAANAQGSQWQEVRANRNQVQNWSWALRARMNWTNINFDNSDRYGNQLWNRTVANSWGSIASSDQAYNQIQFASSAAQGWKLGFAYGSNVSGSSSDSSYLWSQNGRNAVPFTQVYVRPKITQNDLNLQNYSDSGVAGSDRRVLPNNYSMPVRWRTSDASGTGVVGEMNTYVQAITQVGDTVFTGGDFAYLESANNERVNQKFLAGFNVDSGELVRGFMPTFNGQIKALESLPGNKLAVGGEFTQVNGESYAGFVILNASTGEIDRTWDLRFENRLSSGVVHVKTLQRQGEYLYAGGQFTHAKGDTSNTYAYSRAATRFNLSSGSVDWNWRPALNGTVNGLNASEDGNNVYLAGYFSANKNTEYALRLASLNTSDGSISSEWRWRPSHPISSNVGGFQFDVQDAGSSVFTAGTEHMISQYQKNTFTRLNSSLTLSGGDFQDVYKDGNTIYGSCHCGDWIYQGSDEYQVNQTKATDVNQIRLVAAFDADTGQILPEFNPLVSGKLGNGVWESFVDSRGNLWIGGDINSSQGSNGAQKTVGFARYAPRDVKAPATPANLAVSSNGNDDTLTWNGVGEGGTRYQVLRNDRVIATVTGTTYTVPAEQNARYYVRSVDQADNFSASTAAVRSDAVVNPEPTVEPTQEPTQEPTEEPTQEPTVEPTEEPTEEPIDPVEPGWDGVVAKNGDTWQYKLAYSNPSSSWNQINTTERGWSTAPSSLGWGRTANVNTRIDAGWFPPVTMYVRREVTIEDPAEYVSLTINTYADDGIAVYVNGQQVARSQLGTGNLSFLSLARSAVPSSRARELLPVTVTVPSSSLQPGTNVIAAEIHSAYRGTPDVTFDMDAKLNK